LGSTTRPGKLGLPSNCFAAEAELSPSRGAAPLDVQRCRLGQSPISGVITAKIVVESTILTLESRKIRPVGDAASEVITIWVAMQDAVASEVNPDPLMTVGFSIPAIQALGDKEAIVTIGQVKLDCGEGEVRGAGG